jgi:hypothetical protein
MPIIRSFPNYIAPGDPVSAGPVMADFNHILTEVNANAQPLGPAVPLSLVAAQKTAGVQMFTTPPTKVTFPTTLLDINSEYNNALSRFTALRDGKFFVYAALNVTTSTAQSCALLLYANGAFTTSTGIFSQGSLDGPFVQTIQLSGLVSLLATQYIEVFAGCNIGSMSTDASGGSRFNVIQVP